MSTMVITQERSVLDERAAKLEARKQRNRASAEASRKRVRDQMENLENMNALLQDEVARLKQRLASMRNMMINTAPLRRRGGHL